MTSMDRMRTAVKKLSNLNRRMDLLSASTQNLVGTHGDTNPAFKSFLAQEEISEIIKHYNFWKQDLLIDYYDPRRRAQS